MPPQFTRAATISSISRSGEESSTPSSITATSTTAGSTSSFPPQFQRHNSGDWGAGGDRVSVSGLRGRPQSRGREGISSLSSPQPFTDYTNSQDIKSDFHMLSARGMPTEKGLREMEQLRNNARAAEFALRGQEEEMKALRKRIGELEKMSLGGSGKGDPRMELAELQVNLRGQEAELKEKARIISEKERRIKDLEAKLFATSGVTSMSGQQKPSADSQKQISILEEKLRNKDQDLREFERVRASERSLKERASQLAAKVHELEDALRTRGIECKETKDEVEERAKEEVISLKQRLQKSEDEVRNLSLRCTSLEDTIKTLNKRCDTAETAATSASSAESARDAALKQVKELEAQIVKLKSGSTASSAEMAKLQEQIKALEKLSEDRQLQIAKLTAQVSEFTAREESQKAQREKDSASKDKSAAEFKTKMEEELRAARQSAEKCAEAASLAEKSAKNTEERLSKLNEQHSKLTEQQSASVKRIAVLEEELLLRTRERDEAQSKSQAHMSAAEEAAMASAGAAKRATEEALSAVNETRTYKEAMAKMTGDMEALKELLRTAEKGREDALAQVAIHDKMSAQLQQELAAVHRTQEETEKQLNSMAASFKARQTEAWSEASSKKQMATLTQQCETLEKQMAEAKKTLAGKEEEWAHERVVFDTKANIARLQTLLRMAEITKLEEILKATKRVEAVREELIGLLNYNLSAAEGQDLRSNTDAVNKQVRTREERLEALHKKAKTEEERIKQAEQTYQTQSKRLKEKLRILEDELQALLARKPASK